MKHYRHALALLLIGSACSLLAQDGLLDPSFNSNGIVIYDSGQDEAGRDVVVRPDGKIWVLAIKSDTAYDNNYVILLMRYNPDGTLDTGFSDDGLEEFSEGADDTFGNCLYLQPDGKLLIGGSFGNPYVNPVLLLMRVDADGVLDPTFATNGVYMPTDLDLQFHSQIVDLGMQSDGTIVFAENVTGQNFPLVGKFSPEGSPENWLQVLFCSPNCSFSALCVTPDDRIFVAGDHSTDDQGFNHEHLLMGLLPDLTPDTSFSVGYYCGTGNVYIPGIRYYDSATNNAYPSDGSYDVLATPDGHLIMAGTNGYLLKLLKVDLHADPDSTFGTNGWVSTPLAQVASRIALQADGKVIVAGWAPDHGEYVILRYNSDGTLDSSFGEQPGYTATALGAGSNFVRGLALQPDGRALVTCDVPTSAGADVGLVRYTGTPTGIRTNGAMDEVVRIYPDPSAGNFTVEAPADAKEVELMDALGKVVWQYGGPDLGHLSVHVDRPGAYLLCILTAKGRIMRREVVL